MQIEEIEALASNHGVRWVQLDSTKTGQLENPDALCRRIDEASSYVPLENLAISPQCGFASGSLGNLITADDQRRKLDLVVSTARQVWG